MFSFNNNFNLSACFRYCMMSS